MYFDLNLGLHPPARRDQWPHCPSHSLILIARSLRSCIPLEGLEAEISFNSAVSSDGAVLTWDTRNVYQLAIDA